MSSVMKKKTNEKAALCHKTRKNTNINFSIDRNRINTKIDRKFWVGERCIKILRLLTK